MAVIGYTFTVNGNQIGRASETLQEVRERAMPYARRGDSVMVWSHDGSTGERTPENLYEQDAPVVVVISPSGAERTVKVNGEHAGTIQRTGTKPGTYTYRATRTNGRIYVSDKLSDCRAWFARTEQDATTDDEHIHDAMTDAPRYTVRRTSRNRFRVWDNVLNAKAAKVTSFKDAKAECERLNAAQDAWQAERDAESLASAREHYALHHEPAPEYSATGEPLDEHADCDTTAPCYLDNPCHIVRDCTICGSYTLVATRDGNTVCYACRADLLRSMYPVIHEGDTCTCGNYAERSGFDAVDMDGKETEPTLNWPGLYRCNECGQMYRADDITASVFELTPRAN